MAKAIPDGFHALTPHLQCRNASEAIEFYKRAFGAQELSRMPGPDGRSIMHASLKIGDSMLMLCDEFKDWGCLAPPSLGGTPVTIHLYVNDVDAAVKKAVEAGAKVTMPVADMFWGDRYGKIEDPFGHAWSVASHKQDMSPAEQKKAGDEAMKKMKEH